VNDVLIIVKSELNVLYKIRTNTKALYDSYILQTNLNV